MCKAPTEAGSPYGAVPSVSHHNSNEGGQSRAKFVQSLAIRAVYRTFGSVFHRLLVFSSCFPRSLLSLPLRTTFYHILAVSRLLSSRNLMVPDPLGHQFGKVRILVVNRSGDHKGLRLRPWFLRHSFATISLDRRDWRGFSCGNSGSLARSGRRTQS